MKFMTKYYKSMHKTVKMKELDKDKKVKTQKIFLVNGEEVETG